MASIDIQSPTQEITLNDFKAVSDQYGGFLKAARFLVCIRPSGLLATNKYISLSRDLMYLCEAADFPGRSFINLDIRYYGPNHKLPIQTQYDDVNFIFMCRNDSLEREFFDDWMSLINPINTYDFNYRDEYSCDIDLYQFSDVADENDMNVPSYSLTLTRAYPLFVNPQPMSWQDTNFQRLVVNFTFFNWKRKGLDAEPTQIKDLVAGYPSTPTP